MKISRWWVFVAAVLSIIVVRNATAQDPLKVAPDTYKLVFENERVRVIEVVIAAGAKTEKHSHPDHFGYVLSAGKLKISRAAGDPTDADLKVGQILWIPAETHWGENTGETEIRILVTELKEPAKKTKAAKKTK